MKRRIVFCLLTTLLAAQAAAPEVELNAEPHHHLTLENKYVRVYNVEVPPHTDTLMHWHRHDYFAVNLGKAQVVNAVKDKPPVTINLEDGQTTFASAAFAHIAHNQTDQTFRNVTIEIVDDESRRQAAAHGDSKSHEERGLDVLPGGTQQILFVKDGIRASEFEFQPGSGVPARSGSAPLLLIAINDLDILTSPTPSHLNAGSSIWLPQGSQRPIVNAGRTQAKFVTLEFP
jgi:hypothetical protein